MPDAKTSSPALNSFLHGNEEGPTGVVVGDGINNARQLCDIHEDGTKDCLVDGYSAKFDVCVGKFGAKASLMVHKTKQLYQARVERYEEHMKSLRDVRTKLRKHRQTQQPNQKVDTMRVRMQDASLVIDCWGLGPFFEI